MAKQKSIFKLAGEIDGVSFFERDGKYYARKSNPVSGKQIQSDPAFARTRENMREFGSVATGSKLLRDTIRPLMTSLPDKTIANRLHKMLSFVKNLDATNSRGNRNIAAVFNSGNMAAKEAVKSFSFNPGAPLRSVIFRTPAVDTATGVITINGLIPAEHLDFPQEATHVRFHGGWMQIDFVTGISSLVVTNTEVLAVDVTVTNLLLTPETVPTGTGVDFFVLLVSFYQELNGVQYPLKNGAYNALGVLEVG